MVHKIEVELLKDYVIEKKEINNIEPIVSFWITKYSEKVNELIKKGNTKEEIKELIYND